MNVLAIVGGVTLALSVVYAIIALTALWRVAEGEAAAWEKACREELARRTEAEGKLARVRAIAEGDDDDEDDD